jgi:AraC-like DNA-binding protein
LPPRPSASGVQQRPTRRSVGRIAAAQTGFIAETSSALARRLGYQSEAAFSRAFKRMMGVSPASIRRAARLNP